MVARLIDINLWNFLLTFPVNAFFRKMAAFLKLPYDPTAFTAQGIAEGLAVAILVILPLSMLADALICACFGNTPGKYLLGIKPAMKDGGKLDLSTCLRRNYLIYVACYMGGIFFLIPLADLIHYIRFKRTGTTFWDQEEGTVILSPGGSRLRTIIFFILWLVVPYLIPSHLLPH